MLLYALMTLVQKRRWLHALRMAVLWLQVFSVIDSVNTTGLRGLSCLGSEKNLGECDGGLRLDRCRQGTVQLTCCHGDSCVPGKPLD